MRIFNGLSPAIESAEERKKSGGGSMTIYHGPNDDHIVIATGGPDPYFPGGEDLWREVQQRD